MLLAAALMLVGQQADGGIPNPGKAAGYVGDCVDATRRDGVDHSALEARGWKSVQARSGDGSPLPTIIYSHGDLSFLSATNMRAKNIECVVLIPTNGMGRAVELHDALSARFGSTPTGSIAAGAVWAADGHQISLTPMGKAEAPAGLKIRVTMEKK